MFFKQFKALYRENLEDYRYSGKFTNIIAFLWENVL